MAKKTSPERPDLSFEDALDALEATVRKLEEGEIGLDEALACYEDGVKHLKHCDALLKKAERRIELVQGVDAAGSPRTEPLDDETMTLEEKADSRGRRRSKPSSGAARGGRSKMDEPERLF